MNLEETNVLKRYVRIDFHPGCPHSRGKVSVCERASIDADFLSGKVAELLEAVLNSHHQRRRPVHGGLNELQRNTLIVEVSEDVEPAEIDRLVSSGDEVVVIAVGRGPDLPTQIPIALLVELQRLDHHLRVAADRRAGECDDSEIRGSGTQSRPPASGHQGGSRPNGTNDDPSRNYRHAALTLHDPNRRN
jgi:hypothetical protein